MNNTILHINTSAQTDSSRSRKMSQHIVDFFNPQNISQIIQRDLNQAIPFVDVAWVGATFTPVENRTKEQVEKLNFSTHLVSELQAAGTIIIGVPIYNFNIPASFKAWIDMIARVGVTDTTIVDTNAFDLENNKNEIQTQLKELLS
jgi:FMN-dependent NADH-azoreductase